MAVAIDAPATYVAGRKIKVGLLDLKTGEPVVGDDGKLRWEERLPGDTVPEARFWGTQLITNRMCGDLLTADEFKRGVVRPSPGVIQLERVAERVRRAAGPIPPMPDLRQDLVPKPRRASRKKGRAKALPRR